MREDRGRHRRAVPDELQTIVNKREDRGSFRRAAHHNLQTIVDEREDRGVLLKTTSTRLLRTCATERSPVGHACYSPSSRRIRSRSALSLMKP
jgi:hypothetical protein